MSKGESSNNNRRRIASIRAKAEDDRLARKRYERDLASKEADKRAEQRNLFEDDDDFSVKDDGLEDGSQPSYDSLIDDDDDDLDESKKKSLLDDDEAEFYTKNQDSLIENPNDGSKRLKDPERTKKVSEDSKPKRIDDSYDGYDSLLSEDEVKALDAQNGNNISAQGEADDAEAKKVAKKKKRKKRKKRNKRVKRVINFLWALSPFAVLMSAIIAFVILAGSTALIVLSVKEYRAQLPKDFFDGITDMKTLDTFSLNKKFVADDLYEVNQATPDTGESADDSLTASLTDGQYSKALVLTSKYEMGNPNPGVVKPALSDGAGKNYGKYSFTQKWIMPVFVPWLKKNHADLGKTLTATVGSSAFDAQWQALGKSKESALTEAQAEYLLIVQLKPVIKKIKNYSGVDLNNGKYSIGLIDVVASQDNWYPAKTVSAFGDYLKSHPKATSNEIIKYYSDTWVPAHVSGQYARAQINRFHNEGADAMKRTDKFKF